MVVLFVTVYVLAFPSLYFFTSFSPLLFSHFPSSPSQFPSLSPAETSPVELTNLEKSLSVIIDSLKQQNATLVKAVQDLVSELCRITLLWDEMWLAALMQRQGEVHRCVCHLALEKSFVFISTIYKIIG